MNVVKQQTSNKKTYTINTLKLYNNNAEIRTLIMYYTNYISCTIYLNLIIKLTACKQ